MSSAYSLVSLNEGDVGEIFDLLHVMEEADSVSYRTSREEVRAYFDPACLWKASGFRDSDGRLVAFGLLRCNLPVGEFADVMLSGGVDPRVRGQGLGGQLLDVQVRGAHELVQGRAHAGQMLMHVQSDDLNLLDLLGKAGFAITHSFVQMRRKLVDIDLAGPPPFFTVDALDASLLEDVRNLHNEIYADVDPGRVLTPQAWEHYNAYLNLPWSFACWDRRGDRPKLAGYILAHKYEQDWSASGWREGYINEVALSSSYRGKQLLTALFAASMEAIKQTGIEYVGLDVDLDLTSTQPREQVLLYENIGFEVTQEMLVLTKPIVLLD